MLARSTVQTLSAKQLYEADVTQFTTSQLVIEIANVTHVIRNDKNYLTIEHIDSIESFMDRVCEELNRRVPK